MSILHKSQAAKHRHKGDRGTPITVQKRIDGTPSIAMGLDLEANAIMEAARKNFPKI